MNIGEIVPCQNLTKCIEFFMRHMEKCIVGLYRLGFVMDQYVFKLGLTYNF
jgi:hypothetical protein